MISFTFFFLICTIYPSKWIFTIWRLFHCDPQTSILSNNVQTQCFDLLFFTLLPPSKNWICHAWSSFNLPIIFCKLRPLYQIFRILIFPAKQQCMHTCTCFSLHPVWEGSHATALCRSRKLSAPFFYNSITLCIFDDLKSMFKEDLSPIFRVV